MNVLALLSSSPPDNVRMSVDSPTQSAHTDSPVDVEDTTAGSEAHRHHQPSASPDQQDNRSRSVSVEVGENENYMHASFVAEMEAIRSADGMDDTEEDPEVDNEDDVETEEDEGRKRSPQISKHKKVSAPSKTHGKTGICYCGDERPSATRPPVYCSVCARRFHVECLNSTQNYYDGVLLGDDFFHFTCTDCNRGKEVFKRVNMSWIDVVHISLFNLTHTVTTSEVYEDGRKYYHWKSYLCQFIDDHWDQFWLKPRGNTWVNSVASCLSTNSQSGRFESGKVKYDRIGFWALTSEDRFPSSYDTVKSRTVAYNIDSDGNLIDTPTSSKPSQPTQPTSSKKRKFEGTNGATGTSSQNGLHPKVKRAHAGNGSPAPASASRQTQNREALASDDIKAPLGIYLYPDIENPPGPVIMQKKATHSAQQFKMSEDCLTVWNDKGYRLCKASHGVGTGTYYYEVILEYLEKNSNARIGYSQISGDLQGPCGFDRFSYSYRASPPTVYHSSIGRSFGDGYGPGDVLGVMIQIPPLQPSEQADLDSRRWDNTCDYRSYPAYHAEAPDNMVMDEKKQEDLKNKAFPKVTGSRIVYFKNGTEVGVAFENLYLGKYYPAISSYQGARVTINFGPNFQYPPPSTWKGDSVKAFSSLERTREEVTEHAPPEPDTNDIIAFEKKDMSGVFEDESIALKDGTPDIEELNIGAHSPEPRRIDVHSSSQNDFGLEAREEH